MSFVQSAIVEVFRGAIRVLVSIVSAKDRRMVVLERRAKALRLFKDLAATGLRSRDIKVIEKTLTEED